MKLVTPSLMAQACAPTTDYDIRCYRVNLWINSGLTWTAIRRWGLSCFHFGCREALDSRGTRLKIFFRVEQLLLHVETRRAGSDTPRRLVNSLARDPPSLLSTYAENC